jgi:glycerophosphoryl diester phosphodiesterase
MEAEYTSFTLATPISMEDAMNRILIGAHRGAMCHAPENTLAAFEKAIEFGTYRVECDVRQTRDRELILMHDATVERTTDGTGVVREMDLAQIQSLKAGSQVPVPTLKEALACARDRTRLLVELKEKDTTEQVIELIQATGMVGECTIATFHEDCLVQSRVLCPELERAYFLTEPKAFSARAVIETFGIGLLIVWPRAATPEYVADAKNQGLHVRCGFGDSMSFDEMYEGFVKMVDMGVDEVSCGRPDWIGRMIERYHERHSA